MDDQIMVTNENSYLSENGVKKIYGDKKYISEAFSVPLPSLQKWLKEMREHPKYSKGIYNPTYNIVMINIELFDSFCHWKSQNRYKVKKDKN